MKRTAADETTDAPAAAESYGDIGAIRVCSGDIGEAQGRYASGVNGANASDGVERMPIERRHLHGDAVAGALEAQLEGADVFRTEIWIAEGDVQRIECARRGIEQ